MIYAQRGGMDIMVPTTCGQKNTQIFGEILQVQARKRNDVSQVLSSSLYLRRERYGR